MAKKKNGGARKQDGGRASKKSGRGGAWWQVIAAALVTVAVGLALLAIFGDKFLKPGAVKKTEPSHAVKEPVKEERAVDLYFISEDGTHLRAERRNIGKGALQAEAKEALTELIAGPKGKDLTTAIPEGTRLLGIKIKDAVAYVDLSREVVEKHWGGSSAEIQTVYSIVNTLAANFPDIKKVQILVNGKKEATIAGHIDVSHPLQPDKKLIIG